SGGGYGPRGSGTSYAAPVIAGVLAMMLEANGNLTPDVGREILRATAERRDPPTFPDLDPFWNRDWGWGLVNAYRAVRLSELTTDVPSIDTNLQCFVMDHNITQNTAVISGMAWSRGGNVSSVEYRVAGGEWKTATGNGDGWDSWQVTLDLGKIPLGNQTIEIRAVGGEKYSLVDWVVAEGTGASFGMDVPFDFWGNIGYLAAAAAVIVLGYGTWRAMKDRKSTGHAGNVIAQEKPENPQIDMSPEVEAETKEPSS
ncbi:MAG: S8 family serine peptidase, partial [Candidatus Thermoplasmatota archaeon]|nr:S8 family serine peptidase [Candidatus Thermoplasmatota archaeon]